MITAAQLRAARGLLDWTRSDLAKAANVSPETIKNIEHGTFRPQETTAEAIIRAFAMQDVIFGEDQGVRIDKNSVKQYSGAEDFKKFMDDIYLTASTDPEAKTGGKRPICVSNVDDRLFVKFLGDYAETHVQRMMSVKDVKVSVLVKDHDWYVFPDTSYIEYRWNPGQHTSDVPFYVYGNKLAIIMFNQENPPLIIVLRSDVVSAAYREQFNVIWNTCKSRPPVEDRT